MFETKRQAIEFGLLVVLLPFAGWLYRGAYDQSKGRNYKREEIRRWVWFMEKTDPETVEELEKLSPEEQKKVILKSLELAKRTYPKSVIKMIKEYDPSAALDSEYVRKRIEHMISEIENDQNFNFSEIVKDVRKNPPISEYSVNKRIILKTRDLIRKMGPNVAHEYTRQEYPKNPTRRDTTKIKRPTGRTRIR